jgi:linoleoyl-CoA desaturase
MRLAVSDAQSLAGLQSPDLGNFASVLRKRLDAYFVERRISPKADRAMIVKILAGVSLWIGAYSALYLFSLSFGAFVVCYLLHGLAQLFLLLNITHDSNHNAISRDRRVNRAFSLIMDACGVSSYMWRMIHHGGHHSCVNVYGEDEAILGRRLLRFSPAAPWRPMYQYQHIYGPVLYCLFSLDYVLLKDFEYFLIPSQPRFQNVKHPAKEYLLLFAGKTFYLTTMLVLPVWWGGYPLAWVLGAFLAVHVVAGFTSVIVFQTSHVIEETSFPGSRGEYSPFVRHIFATTADYATGNPVVAWLTGGLNHHVVHHLCPHVCHTHYAELTPIVKATALEFGVPYREHRTMREALGKHWSLLRELGLAS